MVEKKSKTVAVAFYKGKGTFLDKAIRFFDKAEFSHCEVVIISELKKNGKYKGRCFEMYSSSPRDGGVRKKTVSGLSSEKWHLIELPQIPPASVENYFKQHEGKKYDYFGALGVIFGTPQSPKRFFCSEFCFNALKAPQKTYNGWRFSPQDLFEIINHW